MKKLSICIPTFGSPDLLRRCVRSVHTNTRWENYELLIMDDGSNNDRTNDYLTSGLGCRYWIETENRGNAAVRTDLVKLSDGDYIAQLDSDVIVTPGWATKLIDALEHRWVDTYTTVEIAAALLSCQVGYFLSRDHPMNVNELIQVEIVGNACTMFRRSLFEKIGFFDPDLHNLWSDLDFCKRLAASTELFAPKSPKVVIDPHVMAYHQGWTDAEGIMREETDRNTRSLPELNTLSHKRKQLHSMSLVWERWGIKHSNIDDLRREIEEAETDGYAQ